jgi:hypothetical protein
VRLPGRLKDIGSSSFALAVRLHSTRLYLVPKTTASGRVTRRASERSGVSIAPDGAKVNSTGRKPRDAVRAQPSFFSRMAALPPYERKKRERVGFGMSVGSRPRLLTYAPNGGFTTRLARSGGPS